MRFVVSIMVQRLKVSSIYKRFLKFIDGELYRSYSLKVASFVRNPKVLESQHAVILLTKHAEKSNVISFASVMNIVVNLPYPVHR